MLELYNFSQSTCSLKVRITLHEKGLPFEDHVLKSSAGEHLQDWYLRLNPNGVVPTLIHDGEPVIESSVIMEYLDDVFPEPALTPDTALDTARMRAWLRYFELVATPAVRYPSFQFGGLRRKFEHLAREEFLREAERRPLKSEFYKKMAGEGFDPGEVEKAVGDVEQTVRRMDDALASSGPWLIGSLYTIADICVAPLLDRMEDLGYDYLWRRDCPNVTDWLQRIQARPAYKKAYYQGSRLSDRFPDLIAAHRESLAGGKHPLAV